MAAIDGDTRGDRSEANFDPPVGETAGEAIERVEFSATSEGEVEDFIGRTYVDNRVRFLAVGPDARFVATTTGGGEISVDEIRSTVDYSAAIDPLVYFLFTGVRGGRIEYGDGHETAVTMAGEGAIYPLGIELAFGAFDLDAIFLRLPRDRMQRTADELMDLAGADLCMEGTAPVSAAIGRHWTAAMGFVHGAMTEGAAVLPPLLLEEMTRALAVSALHTFPNSTMRRGHARRRPATPSARIRRATAFIEANADTPLTVTEIAAAAGVTPRALQYGFRRHLDTTPIAYLRQVRLEAAHNDLCDAGPEEDVTVAEIARRWGFAKPGRFSVHYRETYGRPPSETLRS